MAQSGSWVCVQSGNLQSASRSANTRARRFTIGGWTDDTTPITDAGAPNLFVRNFSGWVHVNSGAAAAVADGGTIAHGCSGTPTGAIVQGPTTGDIVSLTSIGAANLTVAIKDEGGGAGTQATIYWIAWL